jgi:hypothetical protein
MQMWVRGDVGITLSGSSVTQWTDQSTYALNPVQTGTTIRPTFSLGAINSLPSVVFNGTTQYLQMPSGFSDLSSGVSVFAVVKPVATSIGVCRT